MSGSRRTRAAAISLLWLLVGSVEARSDSGIEDPALRMHRTVLPNGLTVLSLEDHATPVVSFQMWVGVGSRDETSHTGLAHLFEHMMFKGSTQIGPEEHARLVQARGGSVNAFTNRDFTVYFEDVPRESLALVIDLEAERVANLDISEKTLESEREVVLEERRLRTEDNPSGLAFENLFALCFVAHPYRRPVIGWKSDVEAISVEVARRFFHRYYVPNNIVIAIAGDFDPAEALERIRARFGRLAASDPIVRNPTREPEQHGERRASVSFDVRSPVLAAAWHAPRSGDPDGPALDVASVILSSGRSSRLYRGLVYDAQQALFAEGAYWELLDAGIFYAFAGVRPGARIERVEGLFFAEIDRLRDEPPSAEELEKAKRQLEVDFVNGLATNHALAARIAHETLTHGRVRSLDERIAEIRAVTAADVQRVVKTYLSASGRSVVHVVNEEAGGS